MAALIVAGVTALGFTQSGIAAGSTAAWMMSVAGPVASGSVVAVCQSIGATGAVSATTAAAANCAAGLATGAFAIWGYLRGKSDNDDDDDDDDDDDNHGSPSGQGIMVLA